MEGWHLRSYLADTATLARKDLRLELRARDTLPAMLLFVASVFVAALGGLGIAGLGKDSRRLDIRLHSDERPERSLLS